MAWGSTLCVVCGQGVGGSFWAEWNFIFFVPRLSFQGHITWASLAHVFSLSYVVLMLRTLHGQLHQTGASLIKRTIVISFGRGADAFHR